MKLISTVITLSLSGLAFAPMASAQGHDRGNFDRGRPEQDTARPDRVAFAHPAAGTERSRDVAPNSREASTANPVAPTIGIAGHMAIERVLDRSTSGGGNDVDGSAGSSVSHSNVATQSANIANSTSTSAGAGGLGVAGHAAIQRVMERTASGGDTDDSPGAASNNSHEHGAMQSSNIAGRDAQAAGSHQTIGMAGRAMMQRAMERGTSSGGEDGSGGSGVDSHVNVTMQSINITGARGTPTATASTTLATEVIRVQVHTGHGDRVGAPAAGVQRAGHPD